MIYHPIKRLTEIGITDICIVTGVEHAGDVISLLGSGKDFGCNFTYKIQDEAGGIAQALALTENFVNNYSMCVILGDNIFDKDLTYAADVFQTIGKGACIMCTKVEHPEKFGVVELNKHYEIVSIKEKPQIPKGNLIATGIYFYDNTVFDRIRKLKPSKRGELEITDVNNSYIKEKSMDCLIFDEFWSDAGTFESLAKANKYMENK